MVSYNTFKKVFEDKINDETELPRWQEDSILDKGYTKEELDDFFCKMELSTRCGISNPELNVLKLLFIGEMIPVLERLDDDFDKTFNEKVLYIRLVSTKIADKLLDLFNFRYSINLNREKYKSVLVEFMPFEALLSTDENYN